MKKYELVEDDQIVVSGHTLYRIRALRDFGDVKAGDLGGYIEKESNLSHKGDCWVDDDAQVFGYARVFDDTWVGDDAWVFGNAQVFGGAKVFGDAKVFGNAGVCGKAQVYGGACVGDDTYVSGKAEVCGRAKVYSDAWVFGDAWVYGDAVIARGANIYTKADLIWFSNVGSGNGTLTVYKGKDGNLIATRGCFTGTLDEFLAKSKRVHNRRIHREYKLLIEVAKSRILGEQKKWIFF